MQFLENINKRNRERSYKKAGQKIQNGQVIPMIRFYEYKNGDIEYVVGVKLRSKQHEVYEYRGVKNKNMEYPVELEDIAYIKNKSRKQYGRRLLVFHDKPKNDGQDTLYFHIVSHDLETYYLKLNCNAYPGQTVVMSIDNTT